MNEIQKAIQFLCDEKGLKSETVLEALEMALAAAYRKDFGSRQGNYKVRFHPETGALEVWDVKEIVADVSDEALEAAEEELARRRETAVNENRELTEEEIKDLPLFNPKTQLMLTEGKEIKPEVAAGEILEIPQEVPGDFGRMAAMTAKQVIIQKLREAERATVYEEFKDQEGTVIQGIIQRRDRMGNLIIDLGRITGLVDGHDVVKGELYRPGSRMQFYIQSVSMGPRGPEIRLSRSTPKMVETIFAQEIPEIDEGSVVIKAIARDAGNRSKVAVATETDSIDPIGACIGQRGSRITTIISELGGEKIDVIQWSENPTEFLKHSLSPAKVLAVELNEEEKTARVTVASDQFSLAIGRGGVNVRLASELTGWKITVLEEGGGVSSEEAGSTKTSEEADSAPSLETVAPEEKNE